MGLRNYIIIQRNHRIRKAHGAQFFPIGPAPEANQRNYRHNGEEVEGKSDVNDQTREGRQGHDDGEKSLQNYGEHRRVPLQAAGDGVWASFVPGVGAGQLAHASQLTRSAYGQALDEADTTKLPQTVFARFASGRANLARRGLLKRRFSPGHRDCRGRKPLRRPASRSPADTAKLRADPPQAD